MQHTVIAYQVSHIFSVSLVHFSLPIAILHILSFIISLNTKSTSTTQCEAVLKIIQTAQK